MREFGRFAREPKWSLRFLIAVAVTAVFIADVLTPRGVAVWVFYFAPLALCFLAWRRNVPIIAASCCTSAVIAGYFLSEGRPTLIGLQNRVFVLIVVWAIAILARQFIASKLALRKQDWMRQAQADLAERTRGEQHVPQVAENVIQFVAGYLDAVAGAVFLKHQETKLRYAAGLCVNLERQPEFKGEESLVGLATQEPILVTDVPPHYFEPSGRMVVTEMILCPLIADGVLQGVIELAFSSPSHTSDLELVKVLSEPIGIALRSAQYRDELEAQRNSLEVSQNRLQEKQCELELSNVQLEAQARSLLAQREVLRSARDELAVKTTQLEQASRYKSEFLANTTHELRTPLNSLLILAKMLSDNDDANLTREQVQFAKNIHSAGVDLLTLINEILDLSKIEAGKMDVRMEPVDIKVIASALARTFEPLAAAKGIALVTDVAGNVPAAIETDALRLEQILKNLMSNAIKFTEKGKVDLRIFVAEERGICFSVRDTGIGIPVEHQVAIFEAFRQADSTTNRRYGGTGLGLSISRELARLLGGTIELESSSRGSEFTLVLPRIYAWHEASKSAARPPWYGQAESTRSVASGASTSKRSTIFAGRRVLIAEDDPRNIFALTTVLEPTGARLEVAATGKQAIAALGESATFDMILMDIMMPEMDGYEAMRTIREQSAFRAIPIIALTARAMPEDRQKCFAAGATDYLAKPIETDRLLSVMQAWMPQV